MRKNKQEKKTLCKLIQHICNIESLTLEWLKLENTLKIIWSNHHPTINITLLNYVPKCQDNTKILNYDLQQHESWIIWWYNAGYNNFFNRRMFNLYVSVQILHISCIWYNMMLQLKLTVLNQGKTNQSVLWMH